MNCRKKSTYNIFISVLDSWEILDFKVKGIYWNYGFTFLIQWPPGELNFLAGVLIRVRTLPTSTSIPSRAVVASRYTTGIAADVSYTNHPLPHDPSF